MKGLFSRDQNAHSGCIHHTPMQRPTGGPRSRWLTLAIGVLALVWLFWRTGTKPNRASYPCQQSAFGLAAAAFGIPSVHALMKCRNWILARLSALPDFALIGIGVLLCLAVLAVGSTVMRGSSMGLIAPSTSERAMPPPLDYHPPVFVVDHARGIEPGRFGGVDDLVTLMGVHGLKFHRSATDGITSGPDGLIDADDVVLLKVNAQWAERGGTNTDVLRGVMRRIVEHPDGFLGEVIVADNGQGSGNLNRPTNNAEDHGQSPQDVVNDFAAEGWNTSTFLWDTIRTTSVGEYTAGNMADGYVVASTTDPESGVKVSYAKFRSAAGTYISYKYGVWSQEEETFQTDRLVIINLPVLKTHSIYAVTAAVKNHMGVVTQSLGTNSHASVGAGGLGSVLAEVRVPDLTILDCIHVLARPGSGPSSPYISASRRDQLVASRDPVALDAWSIKFILIPQIIANGYAYSSYGSTQDPDNPNSVFRRYLDRSMNEMLAAGIAATNDYTAVLLNRWAGDDDQDGDLDLADWSMFTQCLEGPGVPATPDCLDLDFDADGAITLSDVLAFQRTFTDSG